jgi:hypothetical protein
MREDPVCGVCGADVLHDEEHDQNCELRLAWFEREEHDAELRNVPVVALHDDPIKTVAVEGTIKGRRIA